MKKIEVTFGGFIGVLTFNEQISVTSQTYIYWHLLVY